MYRAFELGRGANVGGVAALESQGDPMNITESWRDSRRNSLLESLSLVRPSPSRHLKRVHYLEVMRRVEVILSSFHRLIG